MRISFEGQAFFSRLKTGVAWYTYNIIVKVLELDSVDQFDINIIDFLNKHKNDKSLTDISILCKNSSINKITYMPYGLFIRYPELYSAIPYEFLFSSKPDVSHFFNFVIPKNIKAKTICTIHDMVYKLYPETMSKVNYNINHKNLQRSCRDSDVIVTVSQNSKREISELMNVPMNKIEVTYNAVDRSVFYARKDTELVKSKYDINTDYILYLGTLEPRKNITSIIKAFKIVSERNKDICLVLAGQKGWMYDEIFSLVKEFHLEHRVIFTGYIDETDKPVLYSCATAFLFPSLYEGFGIPPLEAMACGTPVIVSNTSSLPEVVGDAGILVEPHDIENIAYETERLINDNQLKKELSEKGLIQVQKFSWEDSARKVIDIYKRLA